LSAYWKSNPKLSGAFSDACCWVIIFPAVNSAIPVESSMMLMPATPVALALYS